MGTANETIKKEVPGPGFLLISEFARKKKVERTTVYKRLKTEETPDGAIEFVVGSDNLWYIEWEKYKGFHFQERKKRRTPLPPTQ